MREANPQLEWFTSRAGFIRASLSPTAHCYSFPARTGTSTSSSGC